MKSVNTAFLEIASHLTPENKELALSRMKPKLLNRFFHGKVSEEEAIAIQLEREDKALREWRSRIEEMRAKDKHFRKD